MDEPRDGEPALTRGQAKTLQRVALNTTYGVVVIEVDVARAPLTAGAFLDYVDRSGLAGVVFSRAVRADNDRGAPPVQILQTMAALDDGAPSLAHESTATTGLNHVDGAISLARGEIGTARPASFFICVGDQPALNHGGGRTADGQGFSAFGQVVNGMETVRCIHALPTSAVAPDPYLAGQMLSEPVAILGARRVS